MTIKEYIKNNGPTLSSELITFYKDSGLSDEAIRKRISRISDPIKKIKGFFKDNQSFLYLENQYNKDIYHENLKDALKKAAKRYYSIILALEYHKGLLKKEYLASYSFSPINNLKSHKLFNDVISDLIRLNIIYEDDEYYILNPIYLDSSTTNLDYNKATELGKKLLINQFYDYTRNIGLVSYNKGRIHSEFFKFQFCFTAPSYISGITSNVNDNIKPAFVIADFLIGSENNELYVDFFIQKIKIIKSQSNLRFLPFLILSNTTPEALKKLKSEGIIIGFIDKLFGNEYQDLLNSLISVVTNAGAILKTKPEAYIKLLAQLDKLIDGKTNNLRGDLFELAVGYYYSNFCQSLTISKKAKLDDSYKEIDVCAVFQEKIIICECKAYKTKINKEVIENWLESKVPFIYKSIRNHEFDKNIVFEFWSTSGFTDDAIDLLNMKKDKSKKYTIEYYSKKEILEKSRLSRANKILEIMKDYFSDDV